MLLSILVALYSTRLVLNTLGNDDYGIFNLVGGVIAMLSFLNAAMATSSQRYLTYYLGAKESNKLSKIFRSSIILHFAIGIIVVLLLELAGVYIFDDFLNIPKNRIETAKIVYHLMVISTFFTINAVPYDAAINAHEDMLFDAIVGIFESIMKLCIAIALIYVGYDKLILYALLIVALTIVIRIIKSVYCTTQYDECRFKKVGKTDVLLLKEMFSFAGWNMFGALCGIGRSQGIAIIINIFWGTIVNAAYAIANQINGQLYAFSENMLKALRPQIIKSEGSGDRQKMLHLSMMASKYGFFLLAIFAIPLIYEMPFILKLWLKNVPEHTVIFCQLILVSSLVGLITIGLQTAVQSTGKIKLYQSIVGSLLLLNLPAAWMLLKIGCPPYSALISVIVIELIACCFRIYFLKRIAGLSITKFFQKVIIKVSIPISITILFTAIPYIVFEEGIFKFIATCTISSITIILSFYYGGTSYNERQLINGQISILKNRILKS